MTYTGRRVLPPKPDIHHLRKQAKRIHGILKSQEPDAQLADAQYILAREYGFDSWGRLKTEVTRRAAERWRERLALQESFGLAPQSTPPSSAQRIWLGRQHDLTGDDEPFSPAWEPALIHIGFLLLALVIGLGMVVR